MIRGPRRIENPDSSIFRFCRDSHHERTTIPENTSFAWNERLFTRRVKDIGLGGTDLALACGSE